MNAGQVREYEGVHSCPEVKQMLLEAAVMDLEDALSGVVRADEARTSVQRIKNLLNALRVYEPANIEWEHNHD